MSRPRLNTLAVPVPGIPAAGTLLVHGRWWIGEQLGAGSFATVHRAFDTVGEYGEVAVKVFEDVFRDEDNVRAVHDEIVILEHLNHPRCCKLLDVICDDSSSRVYAVMEQGGKELTDIVPPSGFDEPTARRYFKQILEGLAYLHKICVCHRDIKLANILVKQHGDDDDDDDGGGGGGGGGDDVAAGPEWSADSQGSLIIVDFGCSRFARPEQDRSTVCGSLSYMPPEMAAAVSCGSDEALHDGRAVDIWCSGVLLFAMLTGRLPFRPQGCGEFSRQYQMRTEIEGILRGKFDIPGKISRCGRNLLHSMLHADPQQRLTLDEVRNHPWVTEDYSIANAAARASRGNGQVGCCSGLRYRTRPRRLSLGATPQNRGTSGANRSNDDFVHDDACASATFRSSFENRLSASQIQAFRQVSEEHQERYKRQQQAAMCNEFERDGASHSALHFGPQCHSKRTRLKHRRQRRVVVGAAGDGANGNGRRRLAIF